MDGDKHGELSSRTRAAGALRSSATAIKRDSLMAELERGKPHHSQVMPLLAIRAAYCDTVRS